MVKKMGIGTLERFPLTNSLFWTKNVAKIDPFLKKVKKVRKSRPPAVPKIFMPDFRHAHTLQQYLLLVSSTPSGLDNKTTKQSRHYNEQSMCLRQDKQSNKTSGHKDVSWVLIKDCCSVWAWRKSGIKILGTAGGLLFLTFFTFLKKGSIFATFLVQNKEFVNGKRSRVPIPIFWTILDGKSVKKWKKETPEEGNHNRYDFWRFLVQNGRFLVRILEKPGSPTFLSGGSVFKNPRL